MEQKSREEILREKVLSALVTGKRRPEFFEGELKVADIDADYRHAITEALKAYRALKKG